MSLNGPESNEPKVDVTEVDSNKVVQEIKNLADDVDGNPDSQKRLNEELTDAVIDWLNKLDPSAKETLKQSVLRFLENHGNQQWFENLNVWFVKLAESLWLQKNSEWVWGEKESVSWENAAAEVVDNKPKIELPNSPLKWTLDWIDDWEDGKKESKLYSNLVRNRPEEWQEDNSEQWLRLYEATAKLSDQLSKIDELLWNDKLKDNGDINWMKNFLVNVKRAIDNTTENNVKLLQKYIYENLDGQDQTDFWSKSRRKNGEFDWKFWVGTLAGLNKVLENTWKYIDWVADSLNQMEDQEANQKLDSVVSNSSVNYVQWSWDPDLKTWLSNLPEWATVDFFDDTEKAKLSTLGEQEIKVKVEFNWQTKDVLVKIKVTDGSAEVAQHREQPLSQPLVLGDKQYLPMKTVPVLGSEIQWATFYSTINYSSEMSPEWSEASWESSENQPKFTEQTNEVDGDRIYFMRKGDNIYEIKIDSSGNLCPVAKNVSSEVPVVFENNESCMRYLLNKLPSELQGKNLFFAWDGKDYIMWIWWYKKRITIEPMTIAWFWLKWNGWERWATLTESLAFLNLTNYLRNVWEYKDVEFRNDNPDLKLMWNDLYVRVNRKKNVSLDSNWKPLKKWKWLPIDRKQFWLTEDNGVLQRFIKYNNHEDWNDNWDKKTPNKYYKSLKL